MLRHQLIVFVALSIVLLQLHQVNSDNGCNTNFSQVAGKCLLTTLNLYNWREADRHCSSLNAGLLSLENESQLQEISQWLNVTEPWIYEFWTSGNSLGHKGSYYWQSTGEQAKFLPWSAGQPQPANGDCLTLYANDHNLFGFFNYRLSVRDCSATAPLVCEQN